MVCGRNVLLSIRAYIFHSNSIGCVISRSYALSWHIYSFMNMNPNVKANVKAAAVPFVIFLSPIW